MGGMDLMQMWNDMGWVAKLIGVILIIMSMISFGVAIERIYTFAQARKHISILGLRLVFMLRHDNKAAGDEDHRSAGQHRVEEGDEHQKPWDVEYRAADRDRERTADEPEHADEGDRRDDDREDAERKLDGGIDAQAQILSQDAPAQW